MLLNMNDIAKMFKYLVNIQLIFFIQVLITNFKKVLNCPLKVKDLKK